MRAAVIERPGVPVVVEDLELADPGPGQVRVRILASGVCHSDLHVRDGEWQRPGPVVMGHEGAGLIEAVAPAPARTVDSPDDPSRGATHHPAPSPAVGEVVALSWAVPCGVCRSCRSGRPWVCPDSPSFRHGLDADGRTALRRADGSPVRAYLSIGTMAEAQVVPAAAAIPMPVGTPPEVAALIGCCVATGVGAVLNTADVLPGSSIAVIGLGGVGLSAVMGARLAGATTIVAVDRVAAKLDLARDLGATAAILATDGPGGSGSSVESLAAAIRALTHGGPDVVLEAIGRPATVELAIEALPPGGSAVLVGMTAEGERAAIDVYRFVDGGRRILGSNYGSSVPARDFPRYAALHLEGRLPIDRLVDRRIALDEIEPAFDRLRRGEGLRSVIVF